MIPNLPVILTKCAVCATEANSGKKCGRCSTRYCGPACQEKHWEEGGHDNQCRQIKKAGGAELYHANTKYVESVAVAAEACAEDTKGQTCYICTQALHWKTRRASCGVCVPRDGRGCSRFVSGGAGEDSGRGGRGEQFGPEDRFLPVFLRWDTCSLCEQKYHGVVRCALGWACWKSYVGRPERDAVRRTAMSMLGNGLSAASHHEDALLVEGRVAMRRRSGDAESNLLAVQTNLAMTYGQLGLNQAATPARRDAYSGRLKLNGEEHKKTFMAASNYAMSLGRLQALRRSQGSCCAR